MRAGGLLALALLLGACAGSPPPPVVDRYCSSRIGSSLVALPPPAPGQLDRLAAAGFSGIALDTGEVVGLLDVMEAMVAAERRPGQAAQLTLAKVMVSQRILLAMLDVQVALNALDCTSERGLQLRGQLARRDGQRSRNLGLAGLVVGGATAALSGGFSLANLQATGDTMGIIGGSLGAALGAAQLFESATGQLTTPSNLLREIRAQPEQSTLYPPTVWRYLTRRDSPEESNILEEIVAEWREAGLLGEESDDEGMFAAEATFSVEDLDRRNAMLDLVEARIGMMGRDLRVLLEEVAIRPMPGLTPPRPRPARAP